MITRMTQQLDTHYRAALAHLDAVAVYTDQLAEEYANPSHDRGRVADLQTAIGRGLKIAHIHAVLDVGRQVSAL